MITNTFFLDSPCTFNSQGAYLFGGYLNRAQPPPFEVRVLIIQLWCPVRTKIWSIWRLELKKREVMKELTIATGGIGKIELFLISAKFSGLTCRYLQIQVR